MRCPHCSIGIRFQPQEQARCFADTAEGKGIDIQHDFCPECRNLIVILRRGTYKWIDDGGELTSVDVTELLYPKTPLFLTDNRIPDKYRMHYNEAKSVSAVSARAAAALSRRLLEEILTIEYKYTDRDLVDKIKKFLQEPAVPSELKASIDAVRNVGNMGVHLFTNKITGEILDVEASETDWLLEFLEMLLDAKFVQPSIQAERTKRLNEKLLSAGKPQLK